MERLISAVPVGQMTRHQNLAFVKPLETVTGPSETADFWAGAPYAVDGNIENLPD